MIFSGTGNDKSQDAAVFLINEKIHDTAQGSAGPDVDDFFLADFQESQRHTSGIIPSILCEKSRKYSLTGFYGLTILKVRCAGGTHLALTEAERFAGIRER